MRKLAALVLGLVGWRSVFMPPPGPKSVVLVYPHTSNWDFPIGVLFKAKHGVPINWAGKDSLFRWPFRRCLVWLGGVPINRRKASGMIGQLADVFARSERFHICIAPEGTRGKTDHWKTGFYRLALQTGAPVGLGFIDYGRKCAGVERWVMISGDEEIDLQMLRDYYADKIACYPEKAGDIRFHERRATDSPRSGKK